MRLTRTEVTMKTANPIIEVITYFFLRVRNDNQAKNTVKPIRLPKSRAVNVTRSFMSIGVRISNNWFLDKFRAVCKFLW